MEMVVETYLNGGESAALKHLEEIASTDAYSNLMATFKEMVRCCCETDPEGEDDWEAYSALRAVEEPVIEDLLRFMAVQSRIENLNIVFEGDDPAPVVHAIRLAKSVCSLNLECWETLSEGQISQMLAACERVQFLNLRGRWPFIAEGIGQCRQLRVLDANYCGITTVSPAIAACGNLRMLRLRENQLKQLPHSICSLPSLEELDLYDNAIEGSLPLELAQLKHLRKLGIAKNAITDISILEHSIGIVSLQIEQNPIKELPTALSSLNDITFSSTQAVILAAWLMQQSRLRSLILVLDSSENLDLAFIGDISSELTSFEVYPADGFLPRKPISALPVMAKHQGLEMMSILGTDMTHIPAEWIALTALKRLLLPQNEISELPNWLADLPELVDLYLWNNQLRTVPDELLAHPKLRYLKLAENPIPQATLETIATKVAGRITL